MEDKGFLFDCWCVFMELMDFWNMVEEMFLCNVFFLLFYDFEENECFVVDCGGFIFWYFGGGYFFDVFDCMSVYCVMLFDFLNDFELRMVDVW